MHAADIHLDSPLRSLALRDPALADLIGNATRRAFSGIVNLCLEERADALLLSGDLYDGEQTSMKTARFLADQIRLLHEAGIAVFVIRGNHDALSRITRELTFPLSVKIFGARAEAVQVERDRGAIPIAIRAKMNDIDPQAWLAHVLTNIAQHPFTRLDELLPWNWRSLDTSTRQAA